ncbi:hypothetical protein [Brevundimonas variabilis]|uniref:Uncharacterized protein n=1 Tax=Brevundimonas variabilis TaxID=74312 RepID=A0A7W9CFN9_9CAUL|nr:hypothetical protein [Brevundimonas variabilis]MBB5744789.1 hypothetical protein [Brevundimonas variabilis]
MKTLIATTAALMALAGPVLAQTPPQGTARNLNTGVSAGTLPNTFDAPAASTVRVAPAPVAPAVEAAQSAPSSPAVVAATETALKATIAAGQSGTLNYADMTEDLATQVRPRSATLTPIIQGFGALKSVEHRGRENGAELFLVTFDKAVTQWIVGLNPEGKITVLLFRPAPAPAA